MLTVATRLVGFAVIVVALLILQMLVVHAETVQASCKGSFEKSGGYVDRFGFPQWQTNEMGDCEFSRSDTAAMFRVCGYEKFCQVSGIAKSWREGVLRFVHVTSINRIDAKEPSK